MEKAKNPIVRTYKTQTNALKLEENHRYNIFIVNEQRKTCNFLQ